VKGAIAKGIGCDESDITIANFDKESGTADVTVDVDPPPNMDAIAKAFADAGGKYSVN
jgi:hypothetical protein